jgi:small subunit ribosomal protein S14
VAKTSKIMKTRGSAKYAVRHTNRCRICGRPRGYMRDFEMCRICFRELAHRGQIPGVTKASW